MSVSAAGEAGTSAASHFSANLSAKGNINISTSANLADVGINAIAYVVTSGGLSIPLDATITPDPGSQEKAGDPVTISGVMSGDLAFQGQASGLWTVFARVGSAQFALSSPTSDSQSFSYQAHIGDALPFLFYVQLQLERNGGFPEEANADLQITYQIVGTKGPSFSNLSAPRITYGTASTTISGHLDSNADQPVPAGEPVQVTLDGVTQTAALDGSDNFSTTFATSILGVQGAPYTINFSYAGDSTFSSASGSSTLKVDKATPSFSGLSAPTIAAGTASTVISGHLNANAGQQQVPAGEPIEITLNGVQQTALDSGDNFSTTFDTGELDVPGSPYTIGFSYAGDDNFNSATASSTLTVDNATPSFSNLSAPRITYGTASTTISGHLDSNADQPVPAGEPVQVTLDGVTQTAALDGGDNFSTTFDTGELDVPGSPYTIGFSYAGDDNFNSTSGSSTLKVDKATPSFSNLSAPTIAAGTASTVISGRLNANAGQQQVPAGELIEITLNGVQQTTTLDGSDNFSTTFDTGKLDADGSPYTISFSYAGDDNFNGTGGSSTLTVSGVSGVDINVTDFTVNTVHSSHAVRQIQATMTIRNDGTDPTGLFGLVFYASELPVAYDKSLDFTLGSYTVRAGLQPGQSITITRSILDPIYMPEGDRFHNGYYLGVQAIPSPQVTDADPGNNFKTKSGYDPVDAARELALATTLITGGLPLGGVASSFLQHYLDGSGTPMNEGPDSQAALEVLFSHAFRPSRGAADRFIRDILQTRLQGGGSVPATLPPITIPQSVLGLPVFQPWDSLDLYAAIHGTQGSSGSLTDITLTSSPLGKSSASRVTYTGTLTITYYDRYEFDAQDALKGGANDDMRHLAMCGLAAPFATSVTVQVHISGTLIVRTR